MEGEGDQTEAEVISMAANLWKLSTILRWLLRSFLVRWSSIRASTRHSMK